MQSLFYLHPTVVENRLKNRYITEQKIAPILKEYAADFDLEIIGNSREKRPIHAISLGHGTKRILMWSQMHGNESTTTKALFDLLKSTRQEAFSDFWNQLFDQYTLCIIPILNPDGAAVFTRVNAANVDLNRDAEQLSEPESVALRAVYDTFKPDICYNLHGQRTIYGFEASREPSIASFLAPSANEERSITLSRKRSMAIISSIYKELSDHIPNKIGRYDDSFNINCVGDMFQSLGTPTILFEAGQAGNDYAREISRKHMFIAIITALKASLVSEVTATDDYFKIPEHQKCFCDVLVKNGQDGNVAIQYDEVLENGKVSFEPRLVDKSITSAIFGHREIDAKGGLVSLIMKENTDYIKHIKIDGLPTTTFE